METYAGWYHRERSRTGEPVDAALSPPEWADQRCRAAGGEARIEGDGVLQAEGAFGTGERRALAALSLEGEPLGFTWHDVDFIRSLVLADDHHSPDDWFILQRLGERIAALLPPRQD
jgi:hypothetical protein